MAEQTPKNPEKHSTYLPKDKKSSKPFTSGSIALHFLGSLFSLINGELGVRAKDGEHAKNNDAPPNIVQLQTKYFLKKVVIGKKQRKKRVQQPINNRQAESNQNHVICNYCCADCLFFSFCVHAVIRSPHFGATDWCSFMNGNMLNCLHVPQWFFK